MADGIITLEVAQIALQAWLAADLALATSQSYTIEAEGSKRSLTRADAAAVTAKIKYWSGVVSSLTPSGAGGRRRVRYIVPI